MMPRRGRVIQHLGPVSAGELAGVYRTVSGEAYSNKVLREVQKVSETSMKNPDAERRRDYDDRSCVRRRTSSPSSGR